MLSNDDRLSKTIMFLRFPLIIAVVFIHTNLTNVKKNNGVLLVDEGQFPIHDLFRHVISNELARIAVPLFFFISGFLFFYRTNFSMVVYGQKLKKRVRTLLVPYIFWNAVGSLLLLLPQLFPSSMTSGESKSITDYNWLDWLNLFWNDGMPICHQLWFIRDLMFVILFAPILYYLIEFCKVFTVVALGGLWLFGLWFDVAGISITAFFFFSLGAWFSINRRNFTVDFLQMRWVVACLYLMLVVVGTLLWYNKITNYYWVHNIGIVAGLVAVVSWTAYGIENSCLRASTFLAGSAFFVYAYHGIPIALIVKYWVKMWQPVSELTMLTGYFLIPLFIVGLGIALYAVLRRWLPAFMGLITGGR